MQLVSSARGVPGKWSWALSACVAWGAGTAPAGDRFEATLRAAGVESDAAGIAQLLRQALPAPHHAQEVAQLIGRLGSPHFETRQRATTGLLSMPNPAIEALRAAARSDDVEVRSRARRILAEIERGVHLRPLYAAVRTIERRRIQGLAALLLQLIPHWSEDVLLQAARRALVVTATPDDAPLLRQAIRNGHPRSRIAAIQALACVLGDHADADLIQLLNHADQQVCLAAAEVLADKGQRACLRALAMLLQSPDPELRGTSIRYLQAMTGQQLPPADQADGDPATQTARRWMRWLDQYGETAPLRYPASQVLQATWILNHHGHIQFASNTRDDWITRREQLPWGEVRIVKIDLHGCDITDADLVNLRGANDLAWLDLGDCQKITGPGLDQLWPLVQLRRLVLQGTSIDDAGLGQLAFLSDLESLDVTRCSQITDAGLQHLRFLSHLVELRLEDTNVTDEGVRSIAAHPGPAPIESGTPRDRRWPPTTRASGQLTELSLSYSQVTGEGLGFVKHMSGLEILRLYRCPRISDAGLTHLTSLVGLKQLVITCPRVTDLGLAYIARLPNLTHLDLYTTQVTAAGLSRLAGLTGLEYLNLARTRVADDDLDQLRPLTRLTHLDLSHTTVSDAGLQPLGQLVHLSHLSLESTPITGQGLKHLEPLAALTELRLHNSRVDDDALQWIASRPRLADLDLSSTRITDASLPHLQKLTQLKRLDISRTAVTDQGVQHLLGLTGLTHLNLRRTNVSQPTRESLREALPNLEELE